MYVCVCVSACVDVYVYVYVCVCVSEEFVARMRTSAREVHVCVKWRDCVCVREREREIERKRERCTQIPMCHMSLTHKHACMR